MKRIVLMLSVVLVLLIGVNASADQFTFQITIPNTALSSYPAPYADVTVTTPILNSTTATISVDGLTQGSYTYIIGAAQAFDLNINGIGTASAFSWTGGNVNTAFTPGGAGNVSDFGVFNLTIDNFDGFNSAVSALDFTLTLSSGTWANASNVLVPNNDGYIAAAHIFVTAPGTSGAVVTGYAGNGTPIPEPATMLLLGSGLIGLAGFARKKFKK